MNGAPDFSDYPDWFNADAPVSQQDAELVDRDVVRYITKRIDAKKGPLEKRVREVVEELTAEREAGDQEATITTNWLMLPRGMSGRMKKEWE